MRREHATDIKNMFQTNKTLVDVYLGLKGMLIFPSLKFINSLGCNIGGEEGIEEICTGLEKNYVIKKLKIVVDDLYLTGSLKTTIE